MKNHFFKKAMISSLTSLMCASSMTILNLSSLDLAFADTVKTNVVNTVELKDTKAGVVNSAVFIRKGPGVNYSKLGVLQKDQKVKIVSETNSWYKVEYKDSYGYVYKEYITIEDDTEKPQKPQKPVVTKMHADGVVNHNVSVRKSDNIKADKLGTLYKDAEVKIVGKTSNGWYKIKYKDSYGYSYGKYITIKEDTEKPQKPVVTKMHADGVVNHNVNVRKGDNIKADKLGTLYKDAKVKIVGKTSNGWYKVKYKDGYGYSYGKYITVKDDTEDTTVTKTGLVTAQNLNVRKGPSTSSDILDTISYKSKVDIVGVASNGWYKIKYKDSYGYVSNKYIKLVDTTDTTVPDEKTAEANHDVYVRKGPSTSYSKLGVLSKGQKVITVDKTSNGWYKIKYKDGYGYVYGQYLTLK